MELLNAVTMVPTHTKIWNNQKEETLNANCQTFINTCNQNLKRRVCRNNALFTTFKTIKEKWNYKVLLPWLPIRTKVCRRYNIHNMQHPTRVKMCFKLNIIQESHIRHHNWIISLIYIRMQMSTLAL